MNKLTVFFFAATIIALTTGDGPPDRSKFKKAHDDCQADPKTKVGDHIMGMAARGEGVADPNLKPHTLCMAKGLGLIDASGKINKDEVKAELGFLIKDSTKLDEIVNKCCTEKGTAEETAVSLWTCMRENSPRPPMPPDHAHHHH